MTARTKSMDRKAEPNTRGIALPTALFVLLMVNILTLGMYALVQVNGDGAAKIEPASELRVRTEVERTIPCP